MQAVTALLAVFLAIIAWYFSALPRHYRNARKTNLPILISPVNPSAVGWLIISGVIGYARMQKLLPRFLFDRVKYTLVGWEFRCRHEQHETFVLVSPGENTVFITDPEIGYHVMMNWKTFVTVKVANELMSVFGPNLISVEGSNWQRHRRIVAPSLNERIMDAVWKDATAQTQGMMNEFTKPSTIETQNETNAAIEGLKTIAINVIGSVVFGTQRSWAEAGRTQPPAGFKTTYIDSVVSIINNIVPTVFIPAKLLTLPFMPESIKKMGVSKTEFPLHLHRRIATERKQDTPSNTVIGSLVKIAGHGPPVSTSSKTSTYLTEKEIFGNLFAFTIAGFDTTANTLAYAITSLAIDPKWQDWIIEEIDEIAKVHPGAEYSATFPLLTRCLALMYEVLRLFNQVPHIARETIGAQEINGVNFPAGTQVQVCTSVIHFSTKIWGDDAVDFRPSRWIKEDGTLHEPARGEFMAWSAGPRYCPGMKMAQVEFVAVVREIFSKWRVEIVRKNGESEETARERLIGVMDDSSLKLTMQMNRPKDVVLRWAKRSTR